jgi:HSP20 family protein
MTKAIQPKRDEKDLWTELDRQFDQLRSRFFDTYGLAPFGPFAGIAARDDSGSVFRSARADVSDTGSGYKIVAEIPGIPKEKLDIRVRGSLVEIRGETAKETEAKDGEFVQHERSYAGYYRALELPEPVVATEAKAKVENGLLELELPKLHPSPSPEEVHVKVA